MTRKSPRNEFFVSYLMKDKRWWYGVEVTV